MELKSKLRLDGGQLWNAVLEALHFVCWLAFTCSPFGGLYYRIRASQLNTLRLRNKTLQGGIEMLQYVETSDGWKLAMVRYPAKPSSPSRKYPILLIHGLSANRLAFDLPSGPSLARYLSALGYDVWVLEMRGSNLSFHPDFNERIDLRQWVFDDYVDKDVSRAIEFLLAFTGSERIHCLGHSMGGLLSSAYIALSPETAQQIQSNILLGSSLTYEGSGSWYEKILPLYRIAKVFPALAELVVPHGLLSQALCGLLGRGWDFLPLSQFQCNTRNVDPLVVKELYRFGFHTIPMKLVRSLHTAVHKQKGISDSHRVPYLDHMRNMVASGGVVPRTLLVGGVVDGQCPVPAVQLTAQRLRQITPTADIDVVLLGREYGQQEDYGHFDFLVGKRAESEVFPIIAQFLEKSETMAQPPFL